MSRITLPEQPTRASLAAFWTVLCVGLGGSCAVASVVVSNNTVLVVGVGAAAALAFGGAVVPALRIGLYDSWNAAARFYSRAARLLVAGCCYFTVVLAASLLGSDMIIRPPAGRSGWASRTQVAEDTFASLGGVSFEAGRKSQLADLLGWSAQSGQTWALLLVPFLTVLRILEPDGGIGEPSTKIYTLY